MALLPGLTDAFLIGIFADGHKLNLYSPLPFHYVPWDLSNGSEHLNRDICIKYILSDADSSPHGLTSAAGLACS